MVRVMPNTPALVDEGMAAISPGTHCTDEHLGLVEELLAANGHVVRVPEKQQDAVTAISGSGPAYVFLVVEAMIEAGVHLGLPRPTATELAVQPWSAPASCCGTPAITRPCCGSASPHLAVRRPRRCGCWRTTSSEPPSSRPPRPPATVPARWPPSSSHGDPPVR